MSLHRSLKTKSGALKQHRSVLTRAERIAQLTVQKRFDADEDTPLGLVKVTNRAAKKKKAAKQEEAAETQEGVQEGATPTPEG